MKFILTFSWEPDAHARDEGIIPVTEDAELADVLQRMPRPGAGR